MANPGPGEAGAQSFLAQPVTPQNFSPTSSGRIVTSATSSLFTFTSLPGTYRVTFKITNKGTAGAYLAMSNSSTGIVAATVSSTTVPSSTSDYIGAGAILQQDYPPGTDTVSAIQDAATTTLEISTGYGQ